MSISFFIDNGGDYVDANCPHLIEKDAVECICVYDDDQPQPDCHFCKGSGTTIFERYPFELDLSNSNASTLLSALGLAFDYCGDIDGRTLLAAIDRTPVSLIQRQTTEGTGANGCQWINCGIREEQATRYLTILREIAEEAVRREERVCWG